MAFAINKSQLFISWFLGCSPTALHTGIRLSFLQIDSSSLVWSFSHGSHSHHFKMKYEIFFTFFCLLSIGYTQQIQGRLLLPLTYIHFQLLQKRNTFDLCVELPETVNKTACIPLKNLRDAMVQRGLGEARKIRKARTNIKHYILKGTVIMQ